MMIAPIGFIGAGVMGEAIIGGLLKAATPAEAIHIADARGDRVAELTRTLGVVGDDVGGIFARCAVVVLAVKPQDIDAVLATGAGELGPGTVVISIAAGVSTQRLEAALGEVPVVRVMPNTPAQIGAGMSVLSAGRFADAEDLDRARQVMSAAGETVVVPEKLQDAATAVSGSGPAYVFYVAEAMIDAGVAFGLSRQVATTLATQTLLGSARLLAESDASATVLRERVTSPGGSTAAALAAFDERAVRAAIAAGMRAAMLRTQELGRT